MLSVSVHTNLLSEHKDSSDQQEEMPPSTHTLIHTHAHTYTPCAHTHALIQIHTLVHTHTHTHSYTHAHIHTHTHTHTHPHTPAHTPARLGIGTAAPSRYRLDFRCSTLLCLTSASSNSVLLSSFLKVFNISCTPICRNVYKHQTQLALELHSISEKPPLHPGQVPASNFCKMLKSLLQASSPHPRCMLLITSLHDSARKKSWDLNHMRSPAKAFA